MKYRILKYTSEGGREYNQDYLGYKNIDDKVVLVLADGLGGHSGGEIASKTATNAVLDSEELSGKALGKMFEKAQMSVLAKQSEDETISDMRTTLVICVIDDKKAYIGHIGDSRAYVFRDKQIIFQTTDHSLVQVYVNLGEIEKSEIRSHPDKNILRKVLGDEDKFNPEIQQEPIELQIGDSIMLCTDGFWEWIEEEKMLQIKETAKTTKEWFGKMIKQIKENADEGNDNLSAFLINMEE